MAQILIVDDDAQLRRSFRKLLAQEGHEVHTASSAEDGVDAVREALPDLVIMDVRLPGMDGLEGFKIMHGIEPRLPVIIMTAFGTTETAIEATRLGAFDYVLKPFDIPDVLALINQALDAGRAMRSRVDVDAEPETGSEDALVGRSPAMQDVYKAIGRVAATEATVLVRGDSGTGKELVARSIYQYSARAGGPFVVINCVAIPETLLESELFGYEKGAFTGAAASRMGKIEQADGGTVFLDEIGDMPLSIQAKLLRLLEEKSVERLGGGRPNPVDVRILAATNRDLEAAVAEGRFRRDLYYRLDVVSVWLPPLCEREGDAVLLAEHFLARHARNMGLEPPALTDGARDVLAGHAWPGNVRELANTMHKALIFSRGASIGPDEALAAIHGERMEDEAEGGGFEDQVGRFIRRRLGEGGEGALDDIVDHFAARAIEEALQLTGGNRTHAARLLGVSRPTLLARIDKYGIRVETLVSKR
ncbi:sigma-54-dependent transcriptional regulator [Desulfocurvus sp. DL9XJH121]